MPAEQEQRFRKNYPVEGEEKVPESPGRLSIVAGIQRSISFLYGICGSVARRLVCDSNGRLLTAGGSDGSADLPLLTDSSGRLIARVAYDGAADQYILVDATGKPIVLAGSDGVNNLPLLTDAAGQIQVDLSAVSITASTPVPVDTEFKLLSGSETGSGAGTAAYAETVFAVVQRCVDVFIWTNPAIVKIDPDGAGYTSEFEIPADTVYSIPSLTKKISVKNKTGGSNARWQAVGWIGA
jgi:hypothetical protein